MFARPSFSPVLTGDKGVCLSLGFVIYVKITITFPKLLEEWVGDQVMGSTCEYFFSG